MSAEFTAAQEVVRSWVTVHLLDAHDEDQARCAIYEWLEEEPRSREDIVDALEVLTMAVANTYDSAEDFSMHVIEALAENK